MGDTRITHDHRVDSRPSSGRRRIGGYRIRGYRIGNCRHDGHRGLITQVDRSRCDQQVGKRAGPSGRMPTLAWPDAIHDDVPASW